MACKPLSEKLQNFLTKCEEQFANRYTDEDKDFLEYCAKPTPDPPIIDPWFSRPPRRFDRGHQRGGYNSRRGGGRGGSYNDNRRNQWDAGRSHDSRGDYNDHRNKRRYEDNYNEGDSRSYKRGRYNHHQDDRRGYRDERYPDSRHYNDDRRRDQSWTESRHNYEGHDSSRSRDNREGGGWEQGEGRQAQYNRQEQGEGSKDREHQSLGWEQREHQRHQEWEQRGHRQDEHRGRYRNPPSPRD